MSSISSPLETRYRAYIDCINNDTMTADLSTYCNSTVIHNDRTLSLEEYQQLIQEAKEAIPDIHFHIEMIAVDESKGVLAALLVFTGTPARSIQGLEPNGKSVRFSEHVFYHLVEDKISQAWSIVDWDTARAQLKGKHDSGII